MATYSGTGNTMNSLKYHTNMFWICVGMAILNSFFILFVGILTPEITDLCVIFIFSAFCFLIGALIHNSAIRNHADNKEPK